MNRTPIGSRFISRLVQINDQICYSSLMHHQFNETLRALMPDRSKEFTTTVFPSNPFAERIYRRVEDLASFGEVSRVIGHQMGIIAATEHALAYLDEIQSFRAAVHPSIEDTIQDDAEEVQAFEKIMAWSGATPSRGYFNTIGYMRLLRNHLAHARTTLSSAFSSFIANHGHSLNRFWVREQCNTYGLDFGNRNIGSISDDHARAIMSVLRISILHIDEMFASTLSLDDVVVIAIKNVIEAKPQVKSKPQRLIDKVRAKLKFDYGESFTAASVDPHVMAYVSQS